MKKKKVKKTVASALALALLAGGIPFTQIEVSHANVSLNDVNRKIDGSAFRSVAVKQDGSVWTWGVDAGDYINNTTMTSIKTPEPVPGLTNVVEVEEGYMHTAALRGDGTIWSWGYNSSGQFGNGGYANSATPVQVSNVTGLPTNIIDIATGINHTLALTSTGEVWVWGSGYSGELGLGTATKYTTYPQKIPTLSGIIQIDARNETSYAIKNDGTVWTWGANDYGQIGNGNMTDQYTPYQVPGFTGAAKLSAGYNFVTVLKTNGTVWGWGEAQSYEMGNGTNPTYQYTPVQASGISGVIDLNAGSMHVVALKNDGTVWTWGRGYDGLAGNYTYTTWNMTPAKVPITGVVAVAAGDSTSMAVKADGTIWAWGQVAEYDATKKQYVMADHPVMIDFSMLPDTTPPVPATFTASTKALTNQNVLVTINYPTDGTAKEYKIGETGNWVNYSVPVVMSANDTIYARSKDVAGNVSLESSYAVTNIDKIGPVSPSFSVNTETPTNQNVEVTVSYPDDALQAQYKIGTGSWQTYSGPITLTANSTVYARAVDAAGNVGLEGSINVTNIDKFPPTAPTIVADRTSVTNQNIIVKITYSVDSTVKEYRIGTNGSWLPYEGFVVLETNDTVYARSFDAAGNPSSERSLVVNNIDKIAPTKPTATINQNVLIITPGTDASGIDRTEYQINGGTWQTYTGAVTLDDGKYTIDVRTVDKAGNTSPHIIVTADIDTVMVRDVTKAVEEAELAHTQAKVNVAQTLLNKIAQSPEKASLQQRVDVVQSNINLYKSIEFEVTAMNTVVDRGNTTVQEIQTYKSRVAELRVDVNSLPNVLNKPSLHQQLDDLLAKLTLFEKVIIRDDKSNKDVDLDELQKEVDKLPDGDLKDRLQDELDQNKLLQDAIKKVEQAESSKSQDDVNKARDSVAKLPDGRLKDELNDRLDAIQKDIDSNNNGGGNNGGGNGSDPYTDIDQIVDPVAKGILSDAKLYVELAEKHKNRTWIINALDKVESIQNSVKENPLYAIIFNDLNTRINKVKDEYNNGVADQELQQKIAVATSYVTQYEKYKSSYYKTKAQTAVNALPNGDVRDELQSRISAVV